MQQCNKFPTLRQALSDCRGDLAKVQKSPISSEILALWGCLFAPFAGGEEGVDARKYARTEAETAVDDEAVDEQTGYFLHSVGCLGHFSPRQIADIVRHLRAGSLQFLLDSAFLLLQSGKHIGGIHDTVHTSSEGEGRGDH